MLSNLEIFKIPENIKTNIKTYFIFNDSNGKAVIFVTKDDTVYKSRIPFTGFMGKPKVIPDLCQQNVIDFYSGEDFMFAINNKKQVYGWGSNILGQLGLGYKKREILNVYQNKFERIASFDDKFIVQISCGSAHSLALSTTGLVYGWGDNKFGQIGSGYSEGQPIVAPTELTSFEGKKIKLICCSNRKSFALTTDGYVYSWGWNEWCELGHKIGQTQIVFTPLRIDLSNVMSVCLSTQNTYFLTNDGLLYFCGYYEKNISSKRIKVCKIGVISKAHAYKQQTTTCAHCLSEFVSKRISNHTSLHTFILLLNISIGKYRYIPEEMLTIKKKFTDLRQVNIYKSSYSMFLNRQSIATAVSEDGVYSLKCNRIQKTNYNNLFGFYANEYQLTYKTIHLIKNEVIGSRYLDRFEELCEIGSGTFGRVFKVKDKLDGQIYAIKIMALNETNKKALDELNIMAKFKSKYLLQYTTNWIENNKKIFIQMEYCSDNLKNIIKLKPIVLDKKENEKINSIDYFISIEMFKELIECLDYLHSLNPPIIHRDLKPSTVLIMTNNKNGRYLKFCDFGLVKYQQMEALLETESAGSLAYTAPEVINGRHYHLRADIYSLGVIAKELFYLESDSSLYSQNDKNSSIDKKYQNLMEFINAMTQDDYTNRPNCKELLSLIANWLVDRDEIMSWVEFQITPVFGNEFFLKYLNERRNTYIGID